MTPRAKCPYTYNNLVSYLYQEATLCLEKKCFVAAIGMSWATAEYAIEHELYGGSKYREGKLRDPIEFSPGKVPQKLVALWKIFPTLSDSTEQLLLLYQLRNVFLHSRLRDIMDSPVDDYSFNGISVKVGTRLETLLGFRITLMQFGDESRDHPNQRRRALETLFMAPSAPAHEAYGIASEFLDALNRAASAS